MKSTAGSAVKFVKIETPTQCTRAPNAMRTKFFGTEHVSVSPRLQFATKQPSNAPHVLAIEHGTAQNAAYSANPANTQNQITATDAQLAVQNAQGLMNAQCATTIATLNTVNATAKTKPEISTRSSVRTARGIWWQSKIRAC